MTRRLSLQSVDSGCKKIVKNRSAEEVEINSKKQKRMDWPFFFFPKKKRSVFSKTRLPLQASSSIRHVTRHYSCSDGQKCPVSEHCHTWYLMLHLYIFFCFFPNSYTGRNIYFMFQKWLSVFVVSTLSFPPPLFFLLNCICVFHCGHFMHCLSLCTRKLRLTAKCIAYYHFSTFFRGKVVRNEKHEINDVLK